jgi:predicted RNA-binding Zn-ribbon protein involved in translation (DUF1610 family)
MQTVDPRCARGKQTLGALFQTVTRLPGRVAKAGGQDDCAEVGDECKAECGGKGWLTFRQLDLRNTSTQLLPKTANNQLATMMIAPAKMSLSIPISALALYPLLYLLPLNLVRFRWGFEKGLAPMPPAVQEKAEGADRVVLCVAHIILLVVVVLLMGSSPISSYQVGLNAGNWRPALGMGILFSLFPLGLGELFLRNIPPEKVREEPESRGSLAAWCGLNTLSLFAHEFWRAFCIVSLIRLGLPAWLAVLIVAVVYGTLHLPTSIARALGSAAYGATAGFLFVNTGSLLSPLTMGLIAAGAHLYRTRQASSSMERVGTNQVIRHPESRYSRPCPVCGTIIRLSEVHKAVDILACPNCGESLTTEKKDLWVIGALSIVAAAYRDLLYIFVTEGLALVLFFLGAFLLGLFVPPRYKRVGGKSFDKTLSLFRMDKSENDKKSDEK